MQFAKVCSLEDLANGASSMENVNSTSPNVASQAAEQQYSKPVVTHPQELSPRSTDIKSSQNVDSPSRLRKHISSFFSKKLGGGKSGSGPGDMASQSSFYVQTPKSNTDLEAGSSDSATDGAVQQDTQEVGETAGQSNSELGAGAGPHSAGVAEPAGAGNKTKNQTSARDVGNRPAQAGTILTQFINKLAVNVQNLPKHAFRFRKKDPLNLNDPPQFEQPLPQSNSEWPPKSARSVVLQK